MLIPLVCFGCGKLLAPLEQKFLDALKQGKCVYEALSQFRTRWKNTEDHVHCDLRLCCSRSLTGYLKVGSYLQSVQRVQLLRP